MPMCIHEFLQYPIIISIITHFMGKVHININCEDNEHSTAVTSVVPMLQNQWIRPKECRHYSDQIQVKELSLS
jgi:hypothetical protein